MKAVSPPLINAGGNGRIAGFLAAPPTPFSPTEHAEHRFREFFTAHIRYPNTRLAFLAAVRRFAQWCEHGAAALDEVESMVVTAYVDEFT